MAESMTDFAFVMTTAGTAGTSPADPFVLRPLHAARLVMPGGSAAMAPSETHLQVRAVSTSPDAAAPAAKRWLAAHRALLGDLDWLEPLQNVGAWGEDVFEWWCGARKLTVYLENGTAEFIKVWGPDPDTEMESGTVDDFRGLWLWLTTTH